MVKSPDAVLSAKTGKAGPGQFKPRITVFHCFNALNKIESSDDSYEIHSVKMPCSSMTREIFLLRAFEAGADAVVVLVCPVGTCQYMEGNVRAALRVGRVKKILDEIGLDGRRLNIYNIPHGDMSAVDGIIKQNLEELSTLGPNPAA